MWIKNCESLPFDPSERALIRSLEEEDRQTMKDDERQVPLEEYLERTSSDDIDSNSLDLEWRNQKEDEREQQVLLGWLQAQACADDYTGASSFWLQPINQSPSSPSSKALEIAKAVSASQVKHTLEPSVDINQDKVPLDFPEKPVAPTTSNAYEAAQWLIDHSHILSSGGSLYFYENKHYQTVRRDDAKRMILAACRADVKTAGSDMFVKKVYSLLALEPRIVRDPKLLQRNIISCDDVVIDLDTWQMYEHSPDIFVTTRLNVNYQEGCRAQCPVFEHFLEDVTRGDSVLKQRIWEVMGYLLVPDQKGKEFVLFQGRSHSGKSVIGEFTRDCFAGDVVSALEINDLGGNFVLSDLVGKKLCLDLDLPADPFSKKAVSKLKKLTGGDFISSDVKFSDRVKFVCTAKFLFATNHAVLLPNRDEAFNNRLVVVPFGVSVPKEKQDFFLREKLAEERSAIVARALWAYKGLRENSYRFSGYYPPNTVLDTELVSPLDHVTEFVQKRCSLSVDAWTSTAELYADFVSVYGEIIVIKIFSNLFSRVCTMFNFPVEKARDRLSSTSNPIYGFKGIRLMKGIEENV